MTTVILCDPPVAGFSKRRNLNMLQGDVTYQGDTSQERQQEIRHNDDVRKTKGIRFKGINHQDLRKRLGCHQEWNKPGRLRTTPGAENTLQDVKIFTENGKGYA